jgi:glycerol kinase
MTYSYVIAIDQGTHSTRAIIYDKEGEAIFSVKKSIGLHYLEKFHVEQDANEILESCQFVLSEAHSYIHKHQLSNVAVALTTQRSTIIAWNSKSGAAISPALSWLDTRAQKQLRKLKLSKELVKSKTGLQITPHYGASKCQWLLQHDDKVQSARQQNTLLLGPLAAFLIFNLLENNPMLVDYANAHRTLLWNLRTRVWDEDLLKAFVIDESLLPKPVPNTYGYGKLKGLGYPLVLVNGDQNSAMYGYGKLAPNTTFINLGTGGFIMAACLQPPTNNSKLLNSISYSSNITQQYAVEGTINGAGAALSWAQEHWSMDDIIQQPWHDEVDVPIFINTVGGLGSPWWKSNIAPEFLDKQKSYLDYTPQQRKAALMESIIFLIACNLEEMQKSDIQSDLLVVSGGLTGDKQLCQRLADLCSIPLIVSNYEETTSRGAAWLAMDKPDWNFLNGKNIRTNKNDALQLRYKKFITELQRLVN